MCMYQCVRFKFLRLSCTYTKTHILCLSVCLHLSLSVCLSICLSLYPSLRLSTPCLFSPSGTLSLFLSHICFQAWRRSFRLLTFTQHSGTCCSHTYPALHTMLYLGTTREVPHCLLSPEMLTFFWHHFQDEIPVKT